MASKEEAGPVEVPALSQMGGTFAERAAAAQAAAKSVDVEDVEDKSVGSASTKARKATARKKA